MSTSIKSKWIGTSWKMNKTLEEALQYATGLQQAIFDSAIQPFVIPPFTSVRQVKAALANTTVKVGAQNMHWADDGAWTGEISAPMLVDCGLDLVELGHSERREHFGETNETVGLKVRAAIANGLIPLICVGETAEQKDAGQADEILEAQVRGALSELTDADVSTLEQRPILFAYEPVWAIGAQGVPASPEYADERQAKIIQITETLTGHKLACLYGGSVNPDNCVELILKPHIDGLFIGRSAWDVDGYLGILDQCSNTLNTNRS